MKRILLIDRTDVVRERLKELLAHLEGVSIVGDTGDELKGRELAQRLRPEIIIVDPRMVSGHGLELLRAMKQGAGPAPMVIALTDDAYPEKRQVMLGSGADYCFDKATDLQRVVSLLTDAPNGSGAQ